jgi:hypothetical protein
MMTFRLVSAIAIALLVYPHYLAATSIIDSGTGQMQNDKKQEAQRLWELAIAAKGGRERLYDVRNMVFSSRGEYLTHLGKRNPARHDELVVFPNKIWFWDDLRPDVFGLTVGMYNYDTNMCYFIGPDNPNSPAKPIIRGSRRNESLRNAQLFT